MILFNMTAFFFPASANRHAGFTLVELAIVITIIGLLIGGVLKGQEMIQNARINKFAQLYQSYNTAELTFLDIYRADPGDMLAPSAYIQNCTAAPCSTAGNGNRMIGDFSVEQDNFWLHLSRAKLLTGINEQAARTFPPSPVGSNGFFINMNGSGNGKMSYVIDTWDGNGAAIFSPKEALMIDLKMDDGKPDRGLVTSFDGYESEISCVTPSNYNVSESGIACYLRLLAQ